MNSIGAMRGSKETAKGKSMEHKHEMHIHGLGGEIEKKHNPKKAKKKSFAQALNPKY